MRKDYWRQFGRIRNESQLSQDKCKGIGDIADGGTD
jgi:hypothetical protein